MKAFLVYDGNSKFKWILEDNKNPPPHFIKAALCSKCDLPFIAEKTLMFKGAVIDIPDILRKCACGENNVNPV